MIRNTGTRPSRRCLLTSGATLATTALLSSRSHRVDAAADLHLTAGSAGVRLRDPPSPETEAWVCDDSVPGPALDRLQTKASSADFEVLAPSIDRQGLAAIKPFFAEVGVKALRIYVDQCGKAAQTLDIVGLPTTLLIDRMGRECGRFAGTTAWDGAGPIETIRRYLSESPSLSGDGSRVAPSRAAGLLTRRPFNG